MRKKYIRQRILWLYALLPLLVTGCIGEDSSAECLLIPTVEVQVLDPTPDQELRGPIDPEDVKNVVYYVFNKEGKYIDSRTIPLYQAVRLDYPNAGPLHVVAVANCDPHNETTTEYRIGQMIAEGSISLIKLEEYLTHTVYGSPSDLFWGTADAVNDRQGPEHVIVPIDRITGSVNIKIRGLQEFAHTTDEDFTVIVSTDFNTVDFDGVPSGTNTDYSPQNGAFVPGGTYSQFDMPSFNMFSSTGGKNITIRIYHGTTLIDTVTTDKSGDPLTVYNGMLLEVRINYIGFVTVTVINAEWGQASIWKDFM